MRAAVVLAIVGLALGTSEIADAHPPPVRYPSNGGRAYLPAPLTLSQENAFAGDPASRHALIRGAGQDIYVVGLSAPQWGSPVLAQKMAVPATAWCACTTATAPASSSLLAGIGLASYLLVHSSRLGIDLQLASNDPGADSAYGPSGPVPLHLTVLRAALFWDYQLHLGPLVPFAGVEAGGGILSYGTQTLTLSAASLAGFAQAGARAGCRWFFAHGFALGAFVERSIYGPPVTAVGFSFTIPEVRLW